VGKPVGIILFSWVGVKSGLAKLPEGVNWSMITGGGFLAGIGFTMAIFIANLALDGNLLSAAKVGILSGSVISAVVGVILLVLFQPKREQVK
jgi:NhaA family Na+:H+ antiporter